MRISTIILFALLAVLPLQAAVAQQASGAAAPARSTAIDTVFMHPDARIVTAGQPAPADWAPLAKRGVATVINLRTDREMRGLDEAARVRAAGMHYQHLPIAGGKDIDAAHADALWQRIQAASGRVLVHCASGNRAGALLALAMARHGGMAPQQALAFGKKAGLTGLEPRVRELLDLPPAPPARR